MTQVIEISGGQHISDGALLTGTALKYLGLKIAVSMQ